MRRAERPARLRRRLERRARSPAHPATDLLERDAQAHRLHHVVHGPSLESAQLLALATMDRRKDDAKLSGTLLLQLFEDRVAVERRQVDVEQQQWRLRAALRVHLLEEVQRFAPVPKGQEPIATGPEPERQ